MILPPFYVYAYDTKGCILTLKVNAYIGKLHFNDFVFWCHHVDIVAFMWDTKINDLAFLHTSQ